MNSISNLIALINQFLTNKIYSKNLFSNDRKLANYINSSIQMIIFSIKIMSVLDELKLENKLKDIIQRTIISLKELHEIPSEKFTLTYNYDEKLMILTKNLFYEERSCYICLYNLTEEPYTNLYSKDDHISCINFWLNLVNNQSPF